MGRFKKGAPKPKRSGRKKGTPNKFTTLKQAWLDAFMQRGGVDGLLAWAKKNPTAFYTLLSKMLPREVDVKGIVGTVPLPDLDSLTDEDLARLDSIFDQAAARSAASAGGQGGAGPA